MKGNHSMYRLKLPNHAGEPVHLERKKFTFILASIFMYIFFVVLLLIAISVLLSIGMEHKLATIPIAFILLSLSFPNLIMSSNLPQIITFDQTLRKIILRDTEQISPEDAPALPYEQVQSFDIQKKTDFLHLHY